MANDDMLTFYAEKGLKAGALPSGDGRSWRAHEPCPYQLYLAFCRAVITPDGGLVADPEPAQALGLTAITDEALADGRSGFDRPGHGIR